jgi:hypothetical protein
MGTLIKALGITVPDFSSLSKCSVALPRNKLTKELDPGTTVIVDSTGLKVYGKDEWQQEKHRAAALAVKQRAKMTHHQRPILTHRSVTFPVSF